MKIVLASDHAGFSLKQRLALWLKDEGKKIEDLGPFSDKSVDYPDYAVKVCRSLLENRADYGILICNTGIGMSMAANRIKGIRAALCFFPVMAEYARRHNNANVLVLGAGNTAIFLAREICTTFMEGKFEGGRHERRTGKIDSITGL